MPFVPLNTNNSDLANYNNVNNALRDLNNKKIKNADLSTAPGELGGEWQTWVPTYTGFTIGNGTVSARYQQIGKTVKFRFRLVFGSTTAITGNYPDFTYPVAALTLSGSFAGMAHMVYLDSGTAWYYGRRIIASGDTLCDMVVDTANATWVNEGVVNATTPFTWTTNDTINVYGEYEVA